MELLSSYSDSCETENMLDDDEIKVVIESALLAYSSIILNRFSSIYFIYISSYKWEIPISEMQETLMFYNLATLILSLSNDEI